MPLYNDPGFAGLAQRFNLRKNGASQSILPANTSAIGQSYLNSNEGAGGAYQLFSSLADEGKKRAVGNAFSDVYSKYKAATAIRPTLQFTDFLAEVDPNAIYKSMNFFDRGERPQAYQSKYKFIGA